MRCMGSSFSLRLGVATLAFMLLVPALMPAQKSPLTDSARVAGWRSDIDFYLRELHERHYVYRNRPLPPGLIQAAAELSRNTPIYSDERMLAEFEHLASFAGDGHTYILPFAARRVPAHLLPLRLYMFSDGLHVIDVLSGGNEKWIGSRVLRIGTLPAEVVVDRMRSSLSVDNKYGYLWVGPPLLGFQGYLERFAGVTRSDSIPVTLRLPGGKDTSVRIAQIPAPPLRGIPKLLASRLPGAASTPLYLSNVAANFWFRTLPNDILYVQFNQVANAETESLAQFAARLDTAIAASRPHSIIVDVRHNNGGNLQLLPPLLTVLRNYETADNGRIYVLMGRNTFSAAQVFLAQMDRYTNAIFAGEPSSSRPNFVGEESPVMLPWSGAIGSISDQYHETIPGDSRQWIEPSIKVIPRSTDYFANKDPLLEKVLADAMKKR